jgi:hypothetical protein
MLRYNCGHAVLASTTSKMAEKMTMVANPEMAEHLKVQLAGMEPLFHETFLSFLRILLPACFKP